MPELNGPDPAGNSRPAQIVAGKSDAGRRFDVWVEEQLPGISRSRIQALIKAGNITADGKAVKPHVRVHPGMTAFIRVPPPATVELIPEDTPLEILYEDSDLIVINKPAGLVVHPAAGHATGTLVHALLHHCVDLAGIGGERRPGIVHRLDKDTSGVLVAAKNQEAMDGLIRQFKAGSVEKEYVALVAGTPDPLRATVETQIGRSPHDRKKMSARPRTGRRAVTSYEVAEVFEDASLLNIRIMTGRTHQIRVHMAYLGHPVVGDRQYGGRRSAAGAQRQMLHAARLAFNHPREGRRLECRAPWPEDMQMKIRELRRTLTKQPD